MLLYAVHHRMHNTLLRTRSGYYSLPWHVQHNIHAAHCVVLCVCTHCSMWYTPYLVLYTRTRGIHSRYSVCTYYARYQQQCNTLYMLYSRCTAAATPPSPVFMYPHQCAMYLAMRSGIHMLLHPYCVQIRYTYCVYSTVLPTRMILCSVQ